MRVGACPQDGGRDADRRSRRRAWRRAAGPSGRGRGRPAGGPDGRRRRRPPWPQAVSRRQRVDAAQWCSILRLRGAGSMSTLSGYRRPPYSRAWPPAGPPRVDDAQGRPVGRAAAAGSTAGRGTDDLATRQGLAVVAGRCSARGSRPGRRPPAAAARRRCRLASSSRTARAGAPPRAGTDRWRSRQGAEVGAAAERLTEVAGQRAHVGAGAAAHLQHRHRPAPGRPYPSRPAPGHGWSTCAALSSGRSPWRASW